MTNQTNLDTQIKDIKERFPQIPEKDWNFLTKDNPTSVA